MVGLGLNHVRCVAVVDHSYLQAARWDSVIAGNGIITNRMEHTSLHHESAGRRSGMRDLSQAQIAAHVVTAIDDAFMEQGNQSAISYAEAVKNNLLSGDDRSIKPNVQVYTRVLAGRMSTLTPSRVVSAQRWALKRLRDRLDRESPYRDVALELFCSIIGGDLATWRKLWKEDNDAFLGGAFDE